MDIKINSIKHKISMEKPLEIPPKKVKKDTKKKKDKPLPEKPKK
jgi:hypothetical protein